MFTKLSNVLQPVERFGVDYLHQQRVKLDRSMNWVLYKLH